eukprot:GDKI01010777.1.p1 GENE.GDKI01010777.1~~GDKI01010777.1.p1  ORF type:complete len:223 (+),score=32.60 GDKI01010777.1:57-671(+)
MPGVRTASEMDGDTQMQMQKKTRQIASRSIQIVNDIFDDIESCNNIKRTQNSTVATTTTNTYGDLFVVGKTVMPPGSNAEWKIKLEKNPSTADNHQQTLVGVVFGQPFRRATWQQNFCGFSLGGVPCVAGQTGMGEYMEFFGDGDTLAVKIDGDKNTLTVVNETTGDARVIPSIFVHAFRLFVKLSPLGTCVRIVGKKSEDMDM